MTEILSLLSATLGVSVALFLGLWLMSLKIGEPSFVDAFWAFGMVVVAITAYFAVDGLHERQLLLTALCVIWGLRLGFHLLTRWRREGPDNRYARMMKSVKEKRGWSYARASLLFVFLPQAFLMWMVALPVQLGQVADAPPLGWLAAMGAGLAVFGIVFESLADAQLERFKDDPANEGKVMDKGLWAWTRHPNYFGDACTWWGIWLVAAETAPGLLAVIGPIFLTFTLTRWSGAPLLEAGMARSRAGYAEYVERTSGFIPWPPKRRG
ncbi:MAG: DUF1295 domain-containing protein [Pseudomonadota bacterium]